MPSMISPELSETIDAHRAAFTRFSDADGDAPTESTEEDQARHAVVLHPCANDAEFVAKLRHLLAVERELWGEPEGGSPFEAIVVAAAAYLDQRTG